MPVYEYECKDCGNRFEKMQPITADPLRECPVCGQEALRRVFQPVGVIFKGSGWYITDSRKNNSSSSTDTKGSDKPASTEKPEAKSESSSGESTPGPSAPSAPSGSDD